MDRYTARVTQHGNTHRERLVNRLKGEILRNAQDNPSYKDVLLNGVATNMVINYGTQPYYKTYTSLPDQKVLLGDYVEFANETWLVYTADCDDEIYIDGDLRQCNYTLYWQSADGKIVSRKGWAQNASAYNSGRTGNETLELLSNQFMVYLPYDEDTMYLGQKTNFRINMTRDTSRCNAYELTRFDDLNNAYGEKGLLNIILTQHQYNAEVDKQVELEDGTKVWICNYFEPEKPQQPNPDESPILSAYISGGDSLRCGRSKTWTVAFKEQDGAEVTDCEFQWNIVSDYEVTQVVNDKKIQLRVDNEDCIDSSFILQVMDLSNTVIAQIEITVIEGF